MPLHVLISTHTTRHLRRTLLGLACQTRRPDSVVVSCDVDDRAIAELIEGCFAEFNLVGTVVQRPHTGGERLNQVRNNGLRALLLDGAADAAVVLLDGDVVLRSDALSLHEKLCSPRSLVLAYRHDLTEQQTESFDEQALRRGDDPIRTTQEQANRLAARAARYRRQLLWRRFGLGKPHKPKPLGGHMSFRLADAVAVNGFDERYGGYGRDDDDFGRRMYRSRCRPVMAIERIIAYHLFHPTRAPTDWGESSNARLFESGGPTRCEFGIVNPKPQPRTVSTVVRSARSPSEQPQA